MTPSTDTISSAQSTDEPKPNGKTLSVAVIESGVEAKMQSSSAELSTKVDFETAIDAAGFGFFNILLLLTAVPAAMATVFETSTMAFILPSAECDLKLSLLDKGVLNAITYAGMITSAVFWGYIADTKGRKKLLVFGYLADVACVLGGALSQNVVQLMVFKYLGGFVMSGPFAVLMTYLNELHGRQYRQRVMMMVGIMFSLAQLALPLLALTILPQEWNITFIGLTLHSWQIFLAVTAVPGAVGCALLSFFPESPKFLMSQGRNAEAMEAFKLMYALNKHKKKETYPIKELVNEVPEKVKKAKRTTMPNENVGIPNKLDQPTSKFSAGLRQLRPLFVKPYLGLSLWVYVLNFCVLLGQNTMRLWVPQLFASIKEYEHLQAANDNNNNSHSVGTSTSICAILEYSVNRTVQTAGVGDIDGDDVCHVVITAESFTNNLVVGAAGLVGYLFAGFIVNLVGVKRILTLVTLVAGCCGLGMYWSSSALTTTAIASVFITVGSLSGTLVISASVNLFPTQLRTMIVSLEMMFGRLGSLLGNIFFPALMSLGCAPPFLMIALFMFSASLLSAFLPIKNKASLK